MEKPSVSIIVLNYNSGDDLIDCIRSIYDSTSYSFYEVIVVDNASTDDSVEKARKKFPNITLIRNKKNLGYSVGNNIGITHSKGEYIAILNDDVIVTPNWLHELVSAMTSRGKIAFCQPKILLADNSDRINSAGNMLNLIGLGFCKGCGELDHRQFDKETIISSPSGACVLVSRKAIEEIGLLDPLLRYCEDEDWGWRARMFGWKTLYVPTSVVYHKWYSKIGPDKFCDVERSRIINLIKNYSHRTLVLLLPIFIIAETMMLLYSLIHWLIFAKVRSYADLIRLRSFINKEREHLQQNRKCSDRYVIKLFTVDIFYSPLLQPSLPNYLTNVANAIITKICKILRQFI